MKIRALMLLPLLMVSTGLPALALAELDEPEKYIEGMSIPRLKRITTVMQSFVDRQQAAGVTTLVARHGKVVDLRTFMRQRIFEPLQMQDTDFMVPADKLARFAAAYRRGPDNSLLLQDDPIGSLYGQEPKILYAGSRLGGSVLLNPEKTGIPAAAGSYGWAGAAGTNFGLTPNRGS